MILFRRGDRNLKTPACIHIINVCYIMCDLCVKHTYLKHIANKGMHMYIHVMYIYIYSVQFYTHLLR